MTWCFRSDLLRNCWPFFLLKGKSAGFCCYIPILGGLPTLLQWNRSLDLQGCWLQCGFCVRPAVFSYVMLRTCVEVC
jgi:hypothetical protein